VVLTFHTIGDRDAVGSAAALSEYFSGSTLVTPDFITNNARRMLSYLNYSEKVTTRFPKDTEVVIILDANNTAALGKLTEKIASSKARVIFIDHHALHRELNLEGAMFNDESYNSTSSIVYEAMKRIGAEIKKSTAVLLLNGIIADSADMQNSSPTTFRQVAELLEISSMNFSFFTEYYHENIPLNNKYQVIKDIVSARTEIVGDYIMIYGRALEHANVAADTALKLEADATVFWVTSKTEASISARLRTPLDKKLSMHLGLIMEDIGKMLGGTGGGHACAAGAYGAKREAAQAAGEETVRRIREKMLASK
jgi:nanoRNase/pAp phosphatase (c-di-AMP/oligoRNAs hydrolase)